MNAIAVIPARGGSKRIPRKNVKLFAGKPIIAWSIEAARAAGCFEHIVVSTDDAEIAEVARASGASVPFMRPAELSDDFTPTVPVIAHAVRAMSGLGHDAAFACCIYPTAPFVTGELLAQAVEVLRRDETLQYALSVAEFSYPIQRALRRTQDGRVSMIDASKVTTRSQDLERAYHDAGQFYAGRAAAWLAQQPLFGDLSGSIVLPSERVQDIDTMDDWIRAELMFDVWHRRGEARHLSTRL